MVECLWAPQGWACAGVAVPYVSLDSHCDSFFMMASLCHSLCSGVPGKKCQNSFSEAVVCIPGDSPCWPPSLWWRPLCSSPGDEPAGALPVPFPLVGILPWLWGQGCSSCVLSPSLCCHPRSLCPVGLPCLPHWVPVFSLGHSPPYAAVFSVFWFFLVEEVNARHLWPSSGVFQFFICVFSFFLDLRYTWVFVLFYTKKHYWDSYILLYFVIFLVIYFYLFVYLPVKPIPHAYLLSYFM